MSQNEGKATQGSSGPSVMDALKGAVGSLDEGNPEAPQEDKAAKSKRPKPVRVDFSKLGKKKGAPSPFQKAKGAGKRLKLLLWGDSGAGKTVLALQFSKPVVIDTEGGTDLYSDAFDFEVMKTTEPDEIMAAVDWLLANQHDYRTLVIDPVTVYWESLQKKWSDIFLRRNKGSKGFKYEYYDLQVKDWLTVKAEFKEFVRKLIALDMNVIVTAREKTKYKDGSFMQAVGETFDGEKSLPYLFDIVLRLHVDQKGRHTATTLKDRSNRLPKEEFECKYQVFEQLFGKKYLERKAKPIAPATEEQKANISKLLEHFKLTPDQVRKRLAAYGAESIDALTDETAKVIIGKLEEALAKQKKAQDRKEKADA